MLFINLWLEVTVPNESNLKLYEHWDQNAFVRIQSANITIVWTKGHNIAYNTILKYQMCSN